jgi:hypothetical protein
MMAKAPKDLFPEECLAELSLSLLQDPKALVLAVGAVKAHAQVFHPEFLLKTIKNRDCDLKVVGALLSKTKDRRFLKVIAFCREHNFRSVLPSKALSFAFKIGQVQADQEFNNFGIKISQLDSVAEKKITKIDLFLKNNAFIRNRLLFGCNWRADIVSVIEMGFDSPTSVKKRLRCSYETSHRVFNEYVLVQGLPKTA